MSRIFSALLLISWVISVASAQTSTNPTTTPRGTDSTSKQAQPPPPPTPPDVLMPDLGTLPLPQDKKKSAVKRKVEELIPNCLNVLWAFHTCWSTPPPSDAKPAAKGVDPEYAKDMDVGDFYLKERKNYSGATMRFRDALAHKPNDAPATFKLAQSLEGLQQVDEAREQYQNYLKLEPQGQYSTQASKALERLQGKSAVGKSKQPAQDPHQE